jgi:phosphorylcholine metabolism protein LicD
MIPLLRSRRNIFLILLGLFSVALVVLCSSISQVHHSIDPGSRNHGNGIDSTKKEKPKTPKYFREPGGSLARLHYDVRFFHDEVAYGEHTEVLRNLIRSYLQVLGSVGAETWLAHGTLLGWWWNGQIMPWDYDIDVQVSHDTLTWLALNMNNTEHDYTTDALLRGTQKRYLLDINPHYDEIDRGDGRNIIDARWIDMQNGMFIDITGVRQRQQQQQQQQLNDEEDLWSCKNKHRYKARDLWPLRTTEFEGVKARIPYSFQEILADEYGNKALVAEIWHK